MSKAVCYIAEVFTGLNEVGLDGANFCEFGLELDTEVIYASDHAGVEF